MVSKKLMVIALVITLVSVGSALALYTITNPYITNFPQSPFLTENYIVLKCVTESMEPTIHNGNYILVDKSVSPADLNADYPNSDIIVFYRPMSNRTLYIVSRIANKTTIDGKLYFYTKGDANIVCDPWGPVGEDLIVGKVVDTNYK